MSVFSVSDSFATVKEPSSCKVPPLLTVVPVAAVPSAVPRAPASLDAQGAAVDGGGAGVAVGNVQDRRARATLDEAAGSRNRLLDLDLGRARRVEGQLVAVEGDASTQCQRAAAGADGLVTQQF